jgi:hypothetical protein
LFQDYWNCHRCLFHSYKEALKCDVDCSVGSHFLCLGFGLRLCSLVWTLQPHWLWGRSWSMYSADVWSLLLFHFIRACIRETHSVISTPIANQCDEKGSLMSPSRQTLQEKATVWINIRCSQFLNEEYEY